MVDAVRGFRRNAVALRVDVMLTDIPRAHGKKRSRSHVQRHERVRDFIQDFRSEMQPGRRRGHGSVRMSKHRLVTRRVGFIATTVDVRRQRHGTAGINVDIFLQFDDALAVWPDSLNT